MTHRIRFIHIDVTTAVAGASFELLDADGNRLPGRPREQGFALPADLVGQLHAIVDTELAARLGDIAGTLPERVTSELHKLREVRAEQEAAAVEVRTSRRALQEIARMREEEDAARETVARQRDALEREIAEASSRLEAVRRLVAEAEGRRTER